MHRALAGIAGTTSRLQVCVLLSKPFYSGHLF